MQKIQERLRKQETRIASGRMGDFSYYILPGQDKAENYDLPSTPDKAPKRKRVSRKKSFAPSRRNLATLEDGDSSLDLSFEVMDGSTPLPPKRLVKRVRSNPSIEKSGTTQTSTKLSNSSGSTVSQKTTSDKENIGTKVGKNGMKLSAENVGKGLKEPAISSASSAKEPPPSVSPSKPKPSDTTKPAPSAKRSTTAEKESTRKPLAETSTKSTVAQAPSDDVETRIDEPQPAATKGKERPGKPTTASKASREPPPSTKINGVKETDKPTTAPASQKGKKIARPAKKKAKTTKEADNSKEAIEGIHNLLRQAVKEEKDKLDARAKQLKSKSRGAGKKEYEDIQAQKEACDQFLEQALSVSVPLIDKREWEQQERARKRKPVKMKRKLERQVRVLEEEVNR